LCCLVFLRPGHGQSRISHYITVSRNRSHRLQIAMSIRSASPPFKIVIEMLHKPIVQEEGDWRTGQSEFQPQNEQELGILDVKQVEPHYKTRVQTPSCLPPETNFDEATSNRHAQRILKGPPSYSPFTISGWRRAIVRWDGVILNSAHIQINIIFLLPEPNFHLTLISSESAELGQDTQLNIYSILSLTPGSIFRYSRWRATSNGIDRRQTYFYTQISKELIWECYTRTYSRSYTRFFSGRDFAETVRMVTENPCSLLTLGHLTHRIQENAS